MYEGKIGTLISNSNANQGRNLNMGDWTTCMNMKASTVEEDELEEVVEDEEEEEDEVETPQVAVLVLAMVTVN